MDPITTMGATIIVANKAYKVFEDLIYRRIYGVSKEELDASNKEKAKDVTALGEVKRDWIVKSEMIKIQREYNNLGKTLNLSAPYIISEENKIKEGDDLFWNILEHSKKISNAEMQILIAKIIAGEYNNPKTYSMSTLQVLKSLDAKLVNDFLNVLGVSIDGIGVMQDVFSTVEEMKILNVSYVTLLELQNIGLISSNPSIIKSEETVTGVYLNKQIHFTVKDVANNKEFNVPGFYSLTNAGKEIARHLNVKENTNFLSWLEKKYKDNTFNNINIIIINDNEN